MEQGAPQSMPFGFVPGGVAGVPATGTGMTGMPMQAQPFPMQAQPYPMQAQPYPMQAQPYPMQAQPQAAPVAPVGFPSVPQAQAPTQAMSPQQAMARQLINVARMLEQGLPGYQIMISVMGDLVGRSIPGADELIDALRDAIYFHYGALGAIRRFISGETSPDLLSALAAAAHSMARLHNTARPMVERLQQAAPTEVRPLLSGIVQTMNGMDTIVSQATNAVQAVVGPQAWETARVKVYGTAPQP